MPRVIEIYGAIETILDEQDFAHLIEWYMGYEAADYFRELMEELDEYREEDKDYD